MRNKLKWINLPTAFLFLIAFLSWDRCAKLIKPAVLATSGFFLLFGFSQVISYAQSPYLDDSKEIQWQQIHLSKQDILNKAIGTLDLGEYTNETTVIRPNFNAQGGGMDYRSQSNGTLITLSPKYSEQNGFAFGGVVAGAISKNAALGLLLNVGTERKEWMVNAGLDIDDRQRVIASLGQLRQKLDFTFLTGVDRSQITQNNGAFSYQFLMGRSWLNSAELNAYISKTQSRNSSKTFYTDTTSFYELWNDPRRIAGGRVEGLQARMVMTPSEKSSLKMGFGGERLNYDLLIDKEKYLRATGSAELNQQFAYGYSLAASANFASSQNKFALGLSKTFYEGQQFEINLAAIRGRDNTFDDNQITLNFTQFLGASPAHVEALNTGSKNSQALRPLGASSSSVKTDDSQKVPVNQTWLALSDQPKPQWVSSLVYAVAKKPAFLPAQVNAKIDATATPTRMVAIDKTQLPLGSVIDKVSGLLTVPIQISGLNVPVSNIASVTKNASLFSNGGQFALSGSAALVINPQRISQPASTDTYIVTMNNATGGGSTLATLKVSHGSKKIDSVIISSSSITTILSGFTDLNKTFGEQPFNLMQPVSNNATGAYIYTSSNPEVATINGTAVTIVGAGTSTITASQAASGNYSSGSIRAVLNVSQATNPIPPAPITQTPAQLTGLQLSATSGVYGATAPIITPPTSASNAAISYSSSNTSVATITGSTISIVGVGTATITASQAATVNYSSSTTSIDLTVTQATQADLILTANPASITAATGTSTLTVAGGSGSGAVSYALISGDCTLSGNTITAGSTVGLNVCSATATKAAETNYTTVTSAPVNITVTAIGTVATPTFSTAAGAIAFNTTITLASATGADAIYYTTNGTDPTATETATNFKQSSTPLVITSAVTVKALAVKAGYTNSAIATAAYTQAQAAAPTSVTLSLGSSSPVGTTTNVAIPAVAGVDTTGAVRGWETVTADKIKFTVTNGVGASSSITINGAAYTNGGDYTIASANDLSVVVTSTEAGKSSVVMTFTITVAAIETPVVSFGTPNTTAMLGGAAVTNLATSNKTGGSYGAITHASSNASIATVDIVTGAINALSVGTATITATQAAVAGYNKQVTASYTLTVTTLGTVNTPTFSPTAGAVAFGTTVTITSSSGADAIYYTTDGSTPTTASTNQALTPLVINAPVTVKALAVKTNYTNSSIASASYVQPQATAPSAITLAVGTSSPVGGVTNPAIPVAGATDSTGAVTGWLATTKSKIKFTVTNGGTAASSITINGSAYSSGADYQILAANTLTVVVTTTELGKETAVRTFSISVTAPPTYSADGLIINYDASNFSNGASTWTNLGTGGATYNGVVTGSLSLTGTSPAAISIGGNGNPQTKYIDTRYANNDAAWTIEIIAKALSTGGSGDSLLRKDAVTGGQTGWWFGAQGNTWYFRNQTPPADTNRHVITFGSDGKIWVDGVFKNTIPGSENNTSSIKIITGITGNTWEVSRFKYYNRTLSGTEILDNASQQKTELGF